MGGVQEGGRFLGQRALHYTPSASVSTCICNTHNITVKIETHRYYADPQPSVRDILDSTSALTAAISRSLKMGVNRGCHISVNFRTDVFNFLFKYKGSEYSHGPGRIFEREDLDMNFFSTDWYRVHDKLGDGCEVQFPIRLQSRLKWAQTVFIRDDQSGQIHPKNKTFEEVCVIWLVKQRM